MTAPEKRARNLIGSLATSQLLDQWETTTTMNDPNTPTLRGWFMDELEKRFPDQFDKWLDSDCRDEDLRKFIYA
jgi:broad specificity phosphatase PhoE